MEYMIETPDLTKEYKGKAVVKALDMKVPKGSVYGFLGPNGAGKSTTMKMLLSLIRPSKGCVKVDGRKLKEENRLEILRKTGSLIESPSYYGHLTGRENMEIVAGLKKVPKTQIQEILKIVRMENQQDKKTGQYSLGMKQRLGIAMALLGHPEILLLDEPTNGLDPAGIQEIRELICTLPEKYGMTVIVSSHLLSEIDQMATYAGIIDRGELIFQNSMENLHEHSQKSLMFHTLDDEKASELLKEKHYSFHMTGNKIEIPWMENGEVAWLVSELVHADIGILRIEEKQKNLEDIFLSLTGRSLSL